MCGIIAVLRHRTDRAVPSIDTIVDTLDEAGALLAGGGVTLLAAGGADLVRLAAAAERLEVADSLLRGTPGLACLLAEPDLAIVERVAAHVGAVTAVIARLESELDSGRATPPPDQLEAVNAAILRLKDAAWAIGRDRVLAARRVAELAGRVGRTGVAELAGGTGGNVGTGGPGGTGGGPLGAAALDAYWAIQVALSSLDRLEVRGRDSAGLHLLVADHGLDLSAPDIRALLGRRLGDALFTSLAVRTPDGLLSFVYKAAAEIGELGDNVRALRTAIRSDPLLALALRSPTARCTVLGHTRWASVGLISQANAHPLNSDELDRLDGPYVTAALNGDVDNYADLRLSDALRLPAEVTTDAKVIPTLVSRRLAEGVAMDEAFRATVARFDGSVAVAASAAATPDQLHLALRGSGQSLYVGLAEDAFIVASEPYGLVEETTTYLRMDGESTRGQTLTLSRESAGTLGGISRFRYDGGTAAVAPDELHVAEITTRDIDRGGFPHFLLKEISEAPTSFRKTLRGKIVTGADGRLVVRLGEDTLSPDLVQALASGALARVLVIGQGTAAVAGQSAAEAIARCLRSTSVLALPATELSGFGLTDDMSDTLVVAFSQSGTTTDTNRTVALVRARGAHVVAVVNRRNSDLVEKAHGVLYTSDGRDVEMSVASTKAFYAQVAAGWLLAVGLADAAGCGDPERAHRLLVALRELPDAMERTLVLRPDIARIAAALAPPRRYWAVVGSGPDRVAAAELRIKLSELCYKAIACDATEDKKHIDLSSEPMILVCAAGLSGPNADDVAKEVAIYRAHKAAPIVIVTEGQGRRFSAALEVIEVPPCHPDLAFVLSAVVGHLFGYEAALSIDAQARPLREARAAIDESVGDVDVDAAILDQLGPIVARATAPFQRGLREGSYNGHLEAATAVRLVSLLRYASGLFPIEGYELESGKVGTPSALISDLFEALTAGIDELTRPVDAIKHQAKTVTVGISRSEDALLQLTLVKETLSAGASPDGLGYRALRTLAALDPAIEAVRGFTRYRIDWPAVAGPAPGVPTIAVIDQGGVVVAEGLRSRTSADPRLRGSKHRAADEREVTVVRGRSDGRTVVMIPEVKGNQVTGMTLLHVRLADLLPPDVARQVLTGYRDRYSALCDAVTETEVSFDDERLGVVPFVALLTEPVNDLADRWRSQPA